MPIRTVARLGVIGGLGLAASGFAGDPEAPEVPNTPWSEPAEETPVAVEVAPAPRVVQVPSEKPVVHVAPMPRVVEAPKPVVAELPKPVEVAIPVPAVPVEAPKPIEVPTAPTLVPPSDKVAEKPVDKPIKPATYIPPADTPTQIQPEKPVVSKITAAKVTNGATAFATMLAEAKTSYAKVRDYTCHYIRQERVSGSLVPEETCELRVRIKPYSVALRVVAPKEFAGRETCYVAGRLAEKVRFKEAGKLEYTSRKMDDAKVMADTRHTVLTVGLMPVLERIEKAVQVEKALQNPVQILVGDYTFAGRDCVRFEVFADRSHTARVAHRHVLLIDSETKLPVRYEAYDAPKPGATVGELIEVQSFVNTRVNVGLGEAAFDR